MKIALVIGNRPHFIKAAPFLKAMTAYPEMKPFIIHSGQHYDHSMSGAFLEGFHFPPVTENLEVGSGSIGEQTGKILSRLDPVYRRLKPDCVVSMGDTNTTLAASLAAYQLHLPNAHIEAGMRENIWRPEEINKKMADHCADFLFAPIPRAVENLKFEGIEENRIFHTGDITLDTFTANQSAAQSNFKSVCNRFPEIPVEYDLLTLHRAETVDDQDIFMDILQALLCWPRPLVFPVHPRTAKRIDEFGFRKDIDSSSNIICLPPLGYLDFVSLVINSKQVATDSSGVLKEAFYAGKKCIVLDESTEYREIFSLEAAFMAGRTCNSIQQTLNHTESLVFPSITDNPFGTGHAAEEMVKIIRAGL
mgnify:CR=1 FL=1